MAIELAAVYVPIIPSLKGSAAVIQKELGLTNTSKVGMALGGSLAANIGQGVKTAATGTVGTAAAALGVAFVKGFGRLNALDQARQKLLGLGYSASAVATIMRNALASVKGTAFGMDAAATVAASAVAAGIKPGKELERTLKLVADASTIAGTDMGSMGAIFNKVAASNKVQMDVINQLHDAGVPALSALADYMGVTAEEASKMASAGTINFATFQAAMEKSLGGAAQSSGNSFAGAMANVSASLGRIGAGILGGVFPRLAPLFQSATAALGPFEERASAIGAVIGEKVAPAIDWLSQALSGGLGQIELAPQILAPATAAFIALGSSGLAPLIGMIPGLGGLATRLGVLGGPVGLAVSAFLGLVAVSPELQTALGSLLQAVTAAGADLAPVLRDAAQVLSTVLVGAINVATPVIAGVINALAGLISWVTGSRDRFNALAVVVGLAGGAWLTYKTVVGGISFATLIAGLAAKAAAFTVATAAKAKDLAVTATLAAMYTKEFVVAVARTVAGVVASTAAWVANTAALVASKVAMVATRVAMGAATAAQWLFNAALTANPIGLVVAAVGALVAGLVWFFTQTDLGRQIWANFTQFLGEAWANIVAVGTAIWEGLASFFTDLWTGITTGVQTAWTGFTGWITSAVSAVVSWWNGIWSAVGSFFTGLWNGIVNLAVGYVRWYISTLISIVTTVVTWWNNTWSTVGAFFTGLWQRIVAGARASIGQVRTVLMSVVSAIVSWWRSTWNGVSSFFTGLWNGIVNGVRAAGRAFAGVFNGIRSAITNAFRGVVGIVKAPINGIIGLVNSAIRALNGLSVRIPDWVPGIGGSGFGISLPTIPMLADGATVKPRPGGTLAVLAEAGRPESVVDTGLLNRALAEGLSGNGGSGITVQGPLIQVDELVVDTEQRVDQVAQALFARAQQAARASGRVNLGGATV